MPRKAFIKEILRLSYLLKFRFLILILGSCSCAVCTLPYLTHLTQIISSLGKSHIN